MEKSALFKRKRKAKRVKVLEKELATTREELGRVQDASNNILSRYKENEKHQDSLVSNLKLELKQQKSYTANAWAVNRRQGSLRQHLQGKIDNALRANESMTCPICKDPFIKIISKGKIQSFFFIYIIKYKIL
jgi:hypothetical protein